MLCLLLLFCEENWQDAQNDEIINNEDEENDEDSLTQRGKEYTQLKKEMLRSRRAIKVLTGKDAENVTLFS